MWPTRTIIFLASVLLLRATTLQAAPITLHFDTTVANTFNPPVGSFETTAPLPFPVAVGDPVSVTFTYEPSNGTGTYLESGELRIVIGTQQLLVSPFQIKVGSDAFGIIDAPGRIVGIAPEVDRGSFPADQVIISCEGGLGSNCGIVSGDDVHKFTTRLVWEDDQNLQILTSNSLFANASAWNSFRNREMQISFNNGAFIGAFISAVTTVPEPTSLMLLLVCLALGTGHRNPRVGRMVLALGIIFEERVKGSERFPKTFCPPYFFGLRGVFGSLGPNVTLQLAFRPAY